MQTNYVKIGIYDASRLREIIEAEPKLAWRIAVEVVRAHAFADGVTGLNDGWYRTANRVGYARGIFRCTPIESD
jgi:hypothetical protein